MTTPRSLSNGPGRRRLARPAGPALLVALVLPTLPLPLSAITDPSLMPDGRQRQEVRQSERNPFAQQIAEVAEPTSPQEGTTEESRLRRLLRALKVGGIAGKPGDRHLLLGSMILKPGELLPPLLKNQVEVLKTVSIDDHSIVIAFVERDPSTDARQIVLPLGGFQPGVSQMMLGEAFEGLTKIGPSGKIDAPPVTNQGVDDFLQGSRDAHLKNLTDRDVEMMGVVTNEEEKTGKSK